MLSYCAKFWGGCGVQLTVGAYSKMLHRSVDDAARAFMTTSANLRAVAPDRPRRIPRLSRRVRVPRSAPRRPADPGPAASERVDGRGGRPDQPRPRRGRDAPAA